MSLGTKETLLDEMKEKLSDLLTANDMTKVLGLLTDELGNYDVTRLTDYEPEEDDLLSAYIDALNSLKPRRKKEVAVHSAPSSGTYMIRSPGWHSHSLQIVSIVIVVIGFPFLIWAIVPLLIRCSRCNLFPLQP